MPTQVTMPQLGESVIEGTISKWLKAKGEAISEDEPLLEINTDKVDTEIPSPASGIVLDILVSEGTTVRVGEPLALIGSPGEGSQNGEGHPQAAPPSKSAGNGSSIQASKPLPQTVSAAAPTITHGKNQDLGFISPVVAKIAREEGIDLSQVPGTGQGGRITKKDVLVYLKSGAKTSETEKAAAPIQPSFSPASAGPISTASEAPLVSPHVPGEILPLTQLRRSIAEHMVVSKHTSPHVTTVMETDLSRVVAHRQANKDAFARDGVNLTFTAYFIAAIVAGLKAYPIVNSSWGEEGILLHREIHIGMATSLGESGLIVPVIKNADSLSLLGMARSVNDLANRARLRQLKPDEVKGGTFTLTNHGVSGSLLATPIINQPQCGILGVGAVQKRVIVINDAIAIRPMAYVSLTFDHRILDGAIADHFLGKVVESLQNWN